MVVVAVRVVIVIAIIVAESTKNQGVTRPA
jgi:hypothetical protein